MFEQGDTRFEAADWDGFDVTDFSVLDEALEKLEKKVDALESPSPRLDEIVLIEFARNDYYKALNNFTARFLRNAYFLFIDAELEEACIKRIHIRRMSQASNEDRHSVSDTIMRSYYATHNWSDTLDEFAFEGRELQHITILGNNRAKDDFEHDVVDFAEKLFAETIFKNDSSSCQPPASDNQVSTLDNQTSSSVIHSVAQVPVGV